MIFKNQEQKRIMCSHVHSTIIHKTQKQKKPKWPWIDTEYVCTHAMEYYSIFKTGRHFWHIPHMHELWRYCLSDRTVTEGQLMRFPKLLCCYCSNIVIIREMQGQLEVQQLNLLYHSSGPINVKDFCNWNLNFHK